MGSATTQALAATSEALGHTLGQNAAASLEVAGELFAAARTIAGSSALQSALVDAAAPTASRTALVDAVFGAFGATTRELLHVTVSQRWSTPGDLVSGVEQLGIRAASASDDTIDVSGELFGLGRVIAQNPELELALGSRLADSSAKAALIDTVMGGAVSAPTALIVTSLVRESRGRRIRQLLAEAARVVSAQRGQTVATVATAVALTDAQCSALQASLGARYNTRVTIHAVVDPEVIGGLRVQIGDDVIDSSISQRLAELRQRLAG